MTSRIDGFGTKLLTSGQAARIAQVAPHTMAKWVDAGRLPGSFRLPGSKDRRIPARSLVGFLRESGMPVPAYLCAQVILVGLPEALSAKLSEAVPVCSVAHGLVGAGLEVGTSQYPFTIVIDGCGLGRGVAVSAGRTIRGHSRVITLIGIAAEDEVDVREWADAGYSAVFTRPFHDEALFAAVRSASCS